jgi:hypothetical protein
MSLNEFSASDSGLGYSGSYTQFKPYVRCVFPSKSEQEIACYLELIETLVSNVVSAWNTVVTKKVVPIEAISILEQYYVGQGWDVRVNYEENIVLGFAIGKNVWLRIELPIPYSVINEFTKDNFYIHEGVTDCNALIAYPKVNYVVRGLPIESKRRHAEIVAGEERLVGFASDFILSDQYNNYERYRRLSPHTLIVFDLVPKTIVRILCGKFGFVDVEMFENGKIGVRYFECNINNEWEPMPFVEGVLTIGRRGKNGRCNDISFRNLYGLIAKRHATAFIYPQMLGVIDNGSVNGTFVKVNPDDARVGI